MADQTPIIERHELSFVQQILFYKHKVHANSLVQVLQQGPHLPVPGSHVVHWQIWQSHSSSTEHKYTMSMRRKSEKLYRVKKYYQMYVYYTSYLVIIARFLVT